MSIPQKFQQVLMEKVQKMLVLVTKETFAVFALVVFAEKGLGIRRAPICRKRIARKRYHEVTKQDRTETREALTDDEWTEQHTGPPRVKFRE